LIHRHTLKTTAQAEVLAGLKELREHLIISPQDGKSSDADEGMVTYSRAHQNDCPAVHPLTDAAQEAILSEAARVAQEAQAAGNKQREADETKCKAAEKLALDAVAAAATATESPDASQQRKATRAAAEKRFIITTADAKTAQAALATAHAICTKTSKDVASAQQQIKAADKVKTKADEVHKVSVLQLADLEKGVADAKSKLTAAVKRKAAGQELETLTTAAPIAETDKKTSIYGGCN
jgi:hypothetical protein